MKCVHTRVFSLRQRWFKHVTIPTPNHISNKTMMMTDSTISMCINCSKAEIKHNKNLNNMLHTIYIFCFIFQKKCRTIVCPANTRFQNGKCQPLLIVIRFGDSVDSIDLRLLSVSHQRFGDLNYIGVKESIKRFVMLQEDLTL